jgi:Secretion system C-terminal sorting domain
MSYQTKLFFIWLILGQGKLIAQSGIFTVSGNLTLSSTSDTEIQIESASGPGIGHDQVAVVGSLILGGQLTIIIESYSPGPSQLIEIFSYTNTLTGSFSSINWPSSMAGWAIDYGIKSPGKVTLYGPTSALPVDLISFDGHNTKYGNELEWQTASEVNSNYFVIEHSNDGKTFLEIGRSQAKGNSNVLSLYSFVHIDIDLGINYYRLMQVDFDGRCDYSKIISIESDKKNETATFPNPTNGLLQFNSPIEQIDVYDNVGTLIFRNKSVGKSMDISFLPDGIYYLKSNNSISSQKIILQK